MKTTQNKGTRMGGAACLLLLLSACGNHVDKTAVSSTPGAAPVQVSDAKLEPAELLILSKVSSITQDEFAQTIEAPIRAKYPQYKLTYLIEDKQTNMQSLITAGKTPDITITSIAGMYTSLMPYDMQYDLSGLIKKYNYDLTRFEPSTIDSLKNATSQGGIYGLPKYLNGVVLFYNKDIFNKFGVPYPKDGMTWDDVTRLAATMTRSVEGTSYRGMSMFFSNMINENELSLPFIDPKADKASVNVPGFQKLLQTYKGIYDISGNKPETVTADSELTLFHKNKTVAMTAAPMSGFGRFVSDPDLNWDLVAAPTFSDAKGIGYQPNTIYYFISNANKKAEQAFQVVTQLLTNDLQEQANKGGRPTVLKDEKIRATLGADDPKLKDKNLKAVFYNKFAPTPPTNAAMAPLVNASGMLQAQFATMIKQNDDINTTLRIAEDTINKAIADAKNK